MGGRGNAICRVHILCTHTWTGTTGRPMDTDKPEQRVKGLGVGMEGEGNSKARSQTAAACEEIRGIIATHRLGQRVRVCPAQTAQLRRPGVGVTGKHLVLVREGERLPAVPTKRPREPEVPQHGAQPPVQEDVIGLDVAMHHVVALKEAQGGE